MTHEENVRRFWAQVAICQHGLRCRRCCWGWLGGQKGDYVTWYTAQGTCIGAHKFMVELMHGACILPSEPHRAYMKLRFVILHRCTTKPCFQPAHLHVGTYRDNTLDTPRPRRGRPAP